MDGCDSEKMIPPKEIIVAESNNFELSLLQAVSDWQRGTPTEKQRYRRGIRLKDDCANLPAFFREVNLVCYRQVALEKASVWSLLGKQSLTGRISSWTTNTAVAKTFLDGVPPVDDGLTHIVFAIHPKPGQVIVSLSKLLADPNYQSAIVALKQSIDYFENGTGKHANAQDEVVLDIDALDEKDIWVLGGWSSSFDGLVHRAFWYINQRAPTDEEFATFRNSVAELSPEAGARWLRPESTANVLTRVRPAAERLVEIERLREEVRLKTDLDAGS